MTIGLARQRFLAVWLGFALLYMVLAALGHGGLRQTGSWPEVNQHLLQVRAWRGEDIVLTAPDGSPKRVITVDPRLDVTPYFRDWVIDDPRERVLLTNLAVGVRDDGGRLQPVRYLPPDTLAARVLKHEHATYTDAIALFAAGRLRIDGRRVRVLP